MAIRVLTKTILHRVIASTSKQLSSFPNPNPKNFSTNRIVSPEFSQQSQYRKLISLADVFQRYGFPKSQLYDFLSKNRFLMNSNSSEIEKSLKILLSLKSSQEFLISVVYNCPRVLEFEFLKNWEMGISIIGGLNATSLMVQNVLEVSRKFGLGPEDLGRCIQRLKGLGFSDGTVTRILEGFAMVIVMNENGICERIDFLVGIGIDRNRIDWVFNSFPGILACEVQNKLMRLFGEFEDLGFSLDVVRREILRDPSVLGLELGELSRCLVLLRNLKCRVPIKEKIFSDGAFRAGLEVKRRVDRLYSYGLIRRDAFKVLWKEPRAIYYEIEDIEKKIEFLVHRMKFDVLWLVDVPEYLGVNFEKQIVPRYNVIEYLRSKSGLGDEVGLKRLIKLSRLRFYNLYVKPYPECEKMFGRFAGGIEDKNQHPVGMWKLFKPKKYPESKEDLKNIKSFMESLV
ncbi:LOW QUALITY PROTEIN: transcription termination factor MTERF15, mitochondrial [Actinidia eriantha]|uniref:LOW QUALITY PROTEIN: transcription termination factor MTERF15, mitochondrial n=1 Tax=Actinidia eriantha TaxID=165200 RepID=UPI0025906E5C|nr:LOW QUALITY PROTEIN: transcription termination factor MTERF15, mitochondrial [Actinidia eriantha]